MAKPISLFDPNFRDVPETLPPSPPRMLKPGEVVVTDIRIPLGSVFSLLGKWFFASVLLGLIVGVVVGGVWVAVMTALNRG